MPSALRTPRIPLLAYLVCLEQERCGDRDPECLGDLEVEHQLKLRRPLHWVVRLDASLVTTAQDDAEIG
jgi:hypothetical protein